MGRGSGTTSGEGRPALRGLRKVAGGKLLRCAIVLTKNTIQQPVAAVPSSETATQASGEIIHDIKITGDFFMHPEERLEELEAALRGLPISEPALREAIGRFYASGVEVIGAEPGDFVALILDSKQSQ